MADDIVENSPLPPPAPDKVVPEITTSDKLLGANGEPNIGLQGPNASDAAYDLAAWRGAAGLKGDEQLPLIYRKMAQARAQGFSWDEINDSVNQRKQAAQEAGFSNDEINRSLLGVPLDSNPPAPQPGFANIKNAPAEFASMLRDLSDKWFGPHDPFKTMNLPEPGHVGQYPTAGGILKTLGWNALDFAKTFGSTALNGVAAVAESVDGRDKTPWEWGKLGWEVAQLGMMLPMKGVAKGEPLPKPHEFLDRATELARGHPTQNVAETMRALGDHYVNSGEHPEQVPGFTDLMQREPPTEAPIKEGEGAKPADPVRAMAADITAQDKIVAPGRVDSVQPVETPVFEKLMADESGNIALSPRTDIEPETLFQHDPEIASGAIHDWLALTTPGSLAPNAGEAIAAKLAQTSIEKERSMGNIVRFGRAVGELSTPERLKLIDGIETGNLDEYKGKTLGAFAEQLRKELDYWHQRITKAGGQLGYVQDYLPHIYAEPEQASRWFQSRAPLAGGKAFTKERVFGTYAEARQAGLKMASDNPIHISAVAINQMSRYAAALDIVKDFRKNGLIAEVPHGELAPEGAVAINGRLGVTGQGQLYAPRDAALLINNITDKGLARYSLYRVLRAYSNSQIQMQLGLSGYHAMFILQDTMTSALAQGVQQISRGLMNKPSLDTVAEIPRGLLTMAKAPLAPIENYLVGRQVINHLLGTKDGTGDIPILSDAYREGGGRLGMTEDYRGSAYGDFLNAFKGSFMPSTGYATLGQEIGDLIRNSQNMRAFGRDLRGTWVPKVAFQLLGRTMETAAAPIMSHLVPTMKAGTFAMAMRDALRVAPEMGPLEVRHVANLINKSMDNRMGEMVYDNRFWNKTIKDIAHLTVRALGWNAGDIAELPGGVIDAATGKTIRLGDMNQVTYRASYVAGFVAMTAMTGAIIGYMTGNPPETLEDYIFPNSPWGRISIPGYAKDVYNWATKPGDTAVGKLNPMLSQLTQMMSNRDWYGAVIYDWKHEDPITNIEDFAKWYGSQYMPISVKQQLQPTQEQREIPEAMRWLGVNPAPYEVRNPGAAQHYKDQEYQKAVRKRARERAKAGASE